MTRPPNNFKLGLFTLCGLGLLVAGLLSFGARSYFEPTSGFETYVTGDVTGLTVGSAVELRGVRVGKVTGIDFSWTKYKPTQPSYIVVEFEMRDNIMQGRPGPARDELLQSAVTRGLRARIKAKGITGTSVLSLEYVNPAENPPVQVPWTPKYTYIPSAPGEFNELLASIEKDLHHVGSLDFQAINQLILGDLKSAGLVLDHAQQIDLGGLSTNALQLLADLRGSNAKLKSLLQQADDAVERAELQRLSRDWDELAAQLRAVLSRAGPGVASVDFNALNQTVATARQAIHDMDDVLAELKQYPSGFLFGKPPPPLTGVETSAAQ